MIVLLVNKFLHVTGGAETVMFQQWRLLEAAGHAVIPYAMAHPDNVATPYARFFPPGADYGPGARRAPADALRDAARLVWSRPARAGLERLLDSLPRDGQPRLAHLHNIYHQLSPSVLAALQARGIPCVMTAHDFKLVCPNYRLYTQGAACERCVGGRYYNAVLHACVQDSRAKSALCVLEAYAHAWTRAYHGLARVISPSAFLRERLVRAGWDAGRITVIPNAVPLPAGARDPAADAGYILYAGRLVPEKGVRTLLRALGGEPALHGARLVVAGDGPLRGELQAQAAARGLRVEWLGWQAQDALVPLLRGARCLVLPAEWPENGPMAVIEALAHGVPVVASAIGGLPELINDGENGRLVPPGDAGALAAALSALLADAAGAARMGRAARERAQQEHGEALWLERHLRLYEELC